MAIDRLGQEVKVGDWCAITQHNEVFVGKVIKEGNSVTIARNIIEVDLINKKVKYYLRSSKPKELNGETVEEYINRVYNITWDKYYQSTKDYYALSFVRDNKFIKITPTKQMEIEYENV